MRISGFVSRVVFAAAFTVAAATAASATTAINYNVFVKNNFSGSGSDVQGNVAAGGNISMGSYSIGANSSPSTNGGYSVVAAGAYNSTGGSVNNGQVMASTINASNTTYTAGATYSAANSPIDITSEFSRLTGLSADMAANSSSYGTIGTVTNQYNQIFATGTSSNVNVFNIDGSQLSQINTFHLSAPSGSIALFNVSGSSVNIANFGYDGFDPSRVLFNFYQASSVTSNSIQGSVLATGAAYSGSNGAINGQVIANSASGSIQYNAVSLVNSSSGVNLLALRAASSPTPETSIWAMMMVGFGVVGASIRRQRRREVRLLAA